ncbi:hypothetical protein [Alienimonas californiensis]|uniref:Uncharacterized protein n=1 Tax=Alienimonas californiensis TaxID=2527989 RepID=A0A517P7J1_9PLAN|nr:hypothetical protein [Alienimonas californiensis]QDT15330.1 hypothetical protein CA12_14140 [Alienimonas californiensis]
MSGLRSFRRNARRLRRTRRRSARTARGRFRLALALFGLRVAGGAAAVVGGIALVVWTLSLPEGERPRSRRGGGITAGLALIAVGVILLRSARRQARGGAAFGPGDLFDHRDDARPPDA